MLRIGNPKFHLGYCRPDLLILEFKFPYTSALNFDSFRLRNSLKACLMKVITIRMICPFKCFESQPGSFLEASFALTLAMYVSFLGTSNPETRIVCWALAVMSPYGLGSRDASSRFVCDRRSRQLAAGWQTKGADIHFRVFCYESAFFEWSSWLVNLLNQRIFKVCK